MLAALMLLSCLHLAWADGIPKDSNYTVRYNVSCPASGLFFKREVESNALEPGDCYLCFCQNNGTAVCWKRENKRCDLEHYHDFGKSISRMRRSPLSFGEVFIRDATREFFNKQSPEQCKPFESSFSDGCPPVDWCIGCTVCDCDANGRWDCHVLSFCPDKNGKKQMKKRRGHPRSHMAKRQSKTSTTKIAGPTKKTTKPPKKPTRKRSVKTAVKKNEMKQPNNKHRIDPIKGSKVNKFASLKKPLPNLQARKAIGSKNKVTSKPSLLKKQMSKGKNLNMKSSKEINTKNNTIEVAQKVVKQFMTTMQKMIKNIDRTTNSTSKQPNKVIKKRSMNKQENKKGVKEVNNKSKSTPKANINTKDVGKRKTVKPQNSNPHKYARIKRQVGVTENLLQTNDLNNSSKETAWNRSQQSMETTEKQSLFVNPIRTALNTTFTSNNISSNLIQLKSSISPEVYVTDNHIYKENQDGNVKYGRLLEHLNNTKSTVLWTIDNDGLTQHSSNYKLSTTGHPYLSTESVQLRTNRPDVKQDVYDSKVNDGNISVLKKLSNISTEIEHHNCKFKILLEKLIGSNPDRYNETLKNNEAAKKPRRYTVLNKIRRLFKKIFSKNNKRKFYHKDSLYNNDYDTKEFAYKKSANCKLNLKEKKQLSQRMSELKIESDNILKTVRIIKGLIHLLEMNTNVTQNKILSKPDNLKETINKINAIVKNTYINGESGRSVTEEHIQINYVKKNVQVFIKSVGKFARILDDIIQIAMFHIKKQTKMNWNDGVNNKTYTSRDLIQYNTTKYKLEKLKRLILNYNLLQNKFIKDVYVILNNLNLPVTDTKTLQYVHGVNHTNINQTDAIETNSMNIIKNIRKLRLLAERMSAERRRKREIMDDDNALEYLLILMEYLLKRHVDTHPQVNDGIDLLLEAIKSAPDIKLVRKKVLNNVTLKNLVTRTTTPINLFNKDTHYYSSNKERKEKNISVRTRNNNTKVTEQSEDDDDDDEDDKIDEIYRTYKFDKDSSLTQKQDDMLLDSETKSTIIDSDYNIQETTTPKSDNKYKFVLSSTENLAVEVETTSMSPVKVDSNTEDLKDSVTANSNVENILIDAKATKDWIEANFKEVPKSRKVKPKSSTPKRLIATRTHKFTNDISDVSKENEVYDLKKADKTSTEEVMSKKTMNLLNSLDYTGEKDIEDDIDSKDDKYLNDVYG